MKKAKKSLALFISVLVFVSAFTAMLALADGTEVIWSNSFETEEERLQWSFIDSDGDGNNWMWKSSDTNASYTAYDGKYSMYSESYSGTGALKPDNIAVSNSIEIKDTEAPDLRVIWHVASQDLGYVAEHYSVYVVKASVTDIKAEIEEADPVYSETLSEKTKSYHERLIDITEKINGMFADNEKKEIKLIFRHHKSTDNMALKIDAVSLEAYYNYDMLAEYDFEDGLQGWTTIDGDGDGHNWEHKTSSYGFDGKDSKGCMASASYDYEVYTPENYIISPEITIPKKYSSPIFSWYEGAYDDTYFDEYYSVYIYPGEEALTKDNIKSTVEGLTPIYSGYLTTHEYVERSFNLGRDYAGETVRLIFVHHNCSDVYWIKIDNVTIKAYDGSDPITSITVSDVTAPALDGIPVTGKIETVVLEADGEAVDFAEANLTWQKKVGEEYVDLEEGATFETGTVYRANVTVTVGEDYIFTDDTAVTFNNVTNLNVASVDESLRTATASYDFAPFYTVTWDVDGVKTVDTYTEGSEITAYANPVKEGYSFAGWGVEKLPQTMPAENLTFTAAWTVNSYTVTWDNEGTKTEVDYDYNEEIVLPEEPTKTGYSFGGWNGYTEGMKMPAEDVTFTAVWTANNYPATFNANGGAFADGEKSKTIQVAYDSDIVFAEEPVREGYEFKGWTPAVGKMDDVNGKTFEAVWAANTDITYTIETYIMDTTGAYGEPAVETKTDGVTDTTVSVSPEEKEGFTVDNESSVFEGVVAADGSTTLKVYYIRNQYAFITDVDGATTSTDYYYEATVAAPADPEKTGYTFASWNPAVPATMPANDVTVTATWTINKHSVIYMVDDVEYSVVKDVEYGTLVTPIAAPDAREGYTFGWDRTEAFNMPNEDVTINGIWSLTEGYSEYTVEIYLMDEDGNYSEATPTDVIKKATETDAKVTVSSENHSQEAYYIADGETEHEITVTADNLATAKLYFKRLVQKIFYNDDTAQATPSDVEYYYGKEYEIPAHREETREGYTFNGWKDDVTGETIPVGTKVIAQPESNDEVKVYTADWSINKHDVIYVVDGTEYDRVDDVAYGTEVKVLDALTKEGYTFSGWNKTETFAMPDEDVIIEASWIVNQYTITFVNTGDVAYEEITQDYNAAIAAVEDPVKTGYTFMGWDVEIPKTMPANDMTITANWTINQYTITFADTGDTLIEPITQDYATAVTKPSDPVKTGHTFKGWALKKNATEGDKVEFYANMPAENITYYAIWEVNTYNIQWVIGEDTVTKQMAFGSALTPEFGEEDLEMPGYTFVGWLIQGSEEMLDEGDTVPDHDMILEAKWEEAEYTITFDTLGGTPINSVTKKYRKILYPDGEPKPADPTKTGYEFKGWALIKDAAEADIVDIPKTMPAENRTYYAVWKIKTFNVIFKDSLSEEVYSDREYDYNEQVVIPPETQITKTGYTFEGWANESGNKVEPMATMEDIGESGATVTYTAIWTINQYTITFVDTGDVAYEAITQDYNTVIEAVADPVKTGYNFKGWDTEIPATMPAKDMTVTATWEANFYKATFLADGGVFEETGNATYEKDFAFDSDIIAPKDPTKTGYTFGGWTPAVGKMDSVDGKTFTAIWNANGDTAYTVSIYTMDTEGNYGDPEVLDFTAATDSPVSYGPEAKEGFTLDDENNVLSGTVAPDGSTNLVVYYIRNQYTFKTVVDGKETTETYYFDEAVTAPAAPSKTGHTFDGWDGEVPAKMPANDVTLTAKWSVNTYTVTWNVDGKTTETKVAFGKEITALAAPSKEGYTFKSWEGYTKGMKMPAKDVTFKATWSINTYKVTWVADGKTVKTEDYKYGTVINKCAAPAANDGFEFVGWKGYSDGMKMPSKALTFTAEFKCVATVGIVNNYNGSKTIDYGDILVLYAEGEIPEGATVEWYVNGEKKGTGDEFRFTGDKDATITVKLVKNGKVLKDADGNEISEKEEVKVNAGFFKKIISFFKNLFGINREKFN